VDSEGEVLDILVQPRRDCNAALKLLPGRCVGGRCEIIRLDPMVAEPLNNKQKPAGTCVSDSALLVAFVLAVLGAVLLIAAASW
jgi:hypothetical protein